MGELLAQCTGRRKRAIARVRLRSGDGSTTINGRGLEDYFPSRTQRMYVLKPLLTTSKEETYDIDATVTGGGTGGQAGALRLGIARGLVAIDPELRDVLKSEGYLTRDPRKKESKKYGLKKARKAPQFSKR